MIKNILANLLGRSSAVILSIIFTPLIINQLGFEAYGIIAFANIILATTSLIDMGFSISLNRTIAKNSNNIKQNENIATLINNYESFFLICFGLIASVGLLFGYFIQDIFLNTSIYSSSFLYICVVIIFINSAIRLPINTFVAVFLGLERHVFVNIFLFLFSFSRIVIALSIAAYYSDIILFFLIQCLISFLEFIFIRIFADRETGYKNLSGKFSLRVFLPEIKTSINIGFITVLALLISQYDKILFSSYLSLEDFGKYGVIAMIVAGIVSLGYPIATSFFPRMSKVSKDTELLFKNFKFGSSILVIMLMPLTSLIFFYADDILKIYLGGDGLGLEFSSYLSALAFFALFSGMRPLTSNYFFASLIEYKLKNYYLIFIFVYIPILPIFLFTKSLYSTVIILSILNAIFFVYLFFKCLHDMEQSIVANFVKLLLIPAFLIFFISTVSVQKFTDPNISELIFFYLLNLIVLILYFLKTIYFILYKHE